VLWIQFQLKKAGFEVGTIDGVFGAKTLRAVKDFQAARGLTVDGICGMGETVPALEQIG
jgi:peptidoglycan hydrolase-like protein with peptidoglycan-binding domain